MPVVEGLLWKNPGHPGMIVVTSHSHVLEDGRLFLGYGAAKEAVKRIPDIEQQCGEGVLAQAKQGIYGFLPIRPSRPFERIVGFGLFQTCKQWDEPADLDLIHYSMDGLRTFAEKNENVRIRMNFPGVDSGLAPDQVAPLLLPLPENVTICHQGEIQVSIPGSFSGFKAIYLQVESLLQEGKSSTAVEVLMQNGFDIQTAMDQVHAVQRLLREKTEKETERMQRWRAAHTGVRTWR